MANFFKENGYQLFKSVIPEDEILKIREFLESELEKSIKPLLNRLNVSTYEEMLKKLNDLHRQKKDDFMCQFTEVEKRSITGHFSVETRMSSSLWSLPFGQKFQEILKLILETNNLFMHMPPMARFVFPNNTYAGVPPHQDYAYNEHLSDFVTVWIPLVEIDDDCGGVEVFHGSGQQSLISFSQNVNDFWLNPITTFDYKPVHFKMNVGDIIIFNKNIIHASRPNISNRIRYSIDLRIFGENSMSSKHYLDIKSKSIVSPK